MLLIPLYDFLLHDVLGNIAAAFMVAAAGWALRKARRQWRSRTGDRT
ncbi:hypothetical protein ACWGVR_36070 [Streptomyces xanthophaeus]